MKSHQSRYRASSTRVLISIHRGAPVHICRSFLGLAALGCTPPRQTWCRRRGRSRRNLPAIIHHRSASTDARFRQHLPLLPSLPAPCIKTYDSSLVNPADTTDKDVIARSKAAGSHRTIPCHNASAKERRQSMQPPKDSQLTMIPPRPIRHRHEHWHQGLGRLKKRCSGGTGRSQGQSGLSNAKARLARRALRCAGRCDSASWEPIFFSR